MTFVQPCRLVTVLAFAGDRSGSFVAQVFSALRNASSGRGLGPSPLECLLLGGHAGVSTDAGAAVFGFNPDAGGLAAWQVVYRLRNGDAFPGIVTDDTGIFAAAHQHGLAVEAFDVLLPEPTFQFFVAALGNEKRQSQYSYGFPDGDGDCNCITWIERLGLPLLTGRMDEFDALPGRTSYPSRRFGRCL
jgi:hypothetical protein